MQNDASAAEEVAGAERKALDQIISKYNLSEEDKKSKSPSACCASSGMAGCKIAVLGG